MFKTEQRLAFGPSESIRKQNSALLGRVVRLLHSGGE